MEVHVKTAAVFLAQILIPAYAILAVPAEATTYHVRPDGSGDVPTIQAAIDMATDGDLILLESGTYRGVGNVGLSYRGLAITIQSLLRDPATCVIDCEGVTVGVYFTASESAGAILDAVTIRNGLGAQAGGILIIRSSPTIRNCILEDNVCSAGLGGGGISACASRTVVDGVKFHRNTSGLGGGGFSACGGGAPVLRGCVFWENQTIAPLAGGGAISCQESAVTIEDAVLYRNVAEAGAGGVFAVNCTASLLRCTVVLNRGTPAGGVYAGPFSLVSVDHTIMFGNVGSAAECDRGEVALSCSDIWGHGTGDWVGCTADQLGTDGNIAEDPLFCELPTDNYLLRADSPCSAEINLECGQIGALGVGCYEPVPIQPTTWGRIKAGYR
jgi:hypothetical protein